jgi:1-acyl-sn-glycerol-3-phosphate acyltransferase
MIIIKLARKYVGSYLFFIFFYLWTAFTTIPFLPLVLLFPKLAIYNARSWSYGLLTAINLLCGVRYRVIGKELISDSSFIVASKHQSAWETFAFFSIFQHPSFVLKEELMKIPVFGTYLKVLNCISVKRDGSLKDLKTLLTKSNSLLKESSKQLIIFPEGTRVKYGETKEPEAGIYLLYKNLNYPIYTVSHNSGKFWHKGKILKDSGLVEVVISKKIPLNLSKEQFLQELNNGINKVN